VCVQWADAHCGNSGWHTLEDYHDDGELMVYTTGFLIPADQPGGKAGHVTVWQTITDGDGIHPFHIPTAMVRRVQVISNRFEPVTDTD
jgi:hypothetical protein